MGEFPLCLPAAPCSQAPGSSNSIQQHTWTSRASLFWIRAFSCQPDVAEASQESAVAWIPGNGGRDNSVIKSETSGKEKNVVLAASEDWHRDTAQLCRKTCCHVPTPPHPDTSRLLPADRPCRSCKPSPCPRGHPSGEGCLRTSQDAEFTAP